MNEKELEQADQAELDRLVRKSYEALGESGAHYVIDDITALPGVIDDINRRMAAGEKP